MAGTSHQRAWEKPAATGGRHLVDPWLRASPPDRQRSCATLVCGVHLEAPGQRADAHSSRLCPELARPWVFGWGCNGICCMTHLEKQTFPFP